MTYVPDPCFRFTPLLFILLPLKRTFVSLMPFSAQSHALLFLSSVSLLCFLAFPHTCPSPPTHIYIVIRLICPALPASSVAINTLFDVVSCTFVFSVIPHCSTNVSPSILSTCFFVCFANKRSLHMTSRVPHQSKIKLVGARLPKLSWTIMLYG